MVTDITFAFMLFRKAQSVNRDLTLHFLLVLVAVDVRLLLVSSLLCSFVSQSHLCSSFIFLCSLVLPHVKLIVITRSVVSSCFILLTVVLCLVFCLLPLPPYVCSFQPLCPVSVSLCSLLPCPVCLCITQLISCSVL